MGVIVIACYRAKEHKLGQLKELMKSHLQRLREQGLVTNRDSIIAQAANETIVEVFEWKSQEHIEMAHSNPEIQKMWNEYAQVCDYVPLSELDEVKTLFAGFQPLN